MDGWMSPSSSFQIPDCRRHRDPTHPTYLPMTKVEAPVLVNVEPREAGSPVPMVMTPGSEAMMRFCGCWLSPGEVCSKLCSAVRVLTGGRGPPVAETWEGKSG